MNKQLGLTDATWCCNELICYDTNCCRRRSEK